MRGKGIGAPNLGLSTYDVALLEVNKHVANNKESQFWNETDQNLTILCFKT